MNYQSVPILKLKPDPNQPRKYFDEEGIDELSVSIRNEGIINPIEVDENFVIITGERRWRASQKAGLTEVPVKVLSGLPARDRFIRQVQENIHQNTMGAWDTAKALDRVRKWKPEKEGDREYTTVTELKDLFGASESTVREILSLLNEKTIVKDALKNDPNFSWTKILAAKRAPEQYRDELKEMVIKQPGMYRDTVKLIVSALHRAVKYGEHDKAKELLQKNFEGVGVVASLGQINKIVPDEEFRTKTPEESAKAVAQKVIDIMEFLDTHPLDSFDGFHRPIAVRDLNALGFYLQSYLSGKSIELKERPKLLE